MTQNEQRNVLITGLPRSGTTLKIANSVALHEPMAPKELAKLDAEAIRQEIRRFAFHIIGAGRGGTSLLASLIDAHPRCVVHFEEFSRRLLLQTKAPSSDRIKQFLAACDAQAALHPGKLWGHKTTTEHLWTLDLAEFFGASASIPVLFILRDARTCIPSKMRRTGMTLQDAIWRWKFSIQVLTQLKASAGSLLVVRFEDLVTKPVLELERLCGFLSLPYDASMLTGTNGPKMPKEYRRQTFAPDRAIAREDPPWLGEVEVELVDLGYLKGLSQTRY